MNKKLDALKKLIFFGDHSDNEWKEIKKNVDRELGCASREEQEEFMNCGAGSLLEQVLEYMD